MWTDEAWQKHQMSLDKKRNKKRSSFFYSFWWTYLAKDQIQFSQVWLNKYAFECNKYQIKWSKLIFASILAVHIETWCRYIVHETHVLNLCTHFENVHFFNFLTLLIKANIDCCKMCTLIKQTSQTSSKKEVSHVDQIYCSISQPKIRLFAIYKSGQNWIKLSKQQDLYIVFAFYLQAASR